MVQYVHQCSVFYRAILSHKKLRCRTRKFWKLSWEKFVEQYHEVCTKKFSLPNSAWFVNFKGIEVWFLVQLKSIVWVCTLKNRKKEHGKKIHSGSYSSLCLPTLMSLICQHPHQEKIQIFPACSPLLNFYEFFPAHYNFTKINIYYEVTFQSWVDIRFELIFWIFPLLSSNEDEASSRQPISILEF